MPPWMEMAEARHDPRLHPDTTVSTYTDRLSDNVQIGETVIEISFCTCNLIRKACAIKYVSDICQNKTTNPPYGQGKKFALPFFILPIHNGKSFYTFAGSWLNSPRWE